MRRLEHDRGEGVQVTGVEGGHPAGHRDRVHRDAGMVVLTHEVEPDRGDLLVAERGALGAAGDDPDVVDGSERTGCGSVTAMGFVRYVSHPDVVVDPDVPVPQLAPQRGRPPAARRDADPSLGAPPSAGSSPARRRSPSRRRPRWRSQLGLQVEVRPATGEIDRSATGYLPAVEHERVADALFAHPDVSSAGWERAVDAQVRIVAALADVLVGSRHRRRCRRGRARGGRHAVVVPPRRRADRSRAGTSRDRAT